MTELPWAGDACSLVDAFRAGDRSPREEVEATIAAIERSDLNCFSHVDPEHALEAADRVDVALPFGGVPMGVKELDRVSGWPDTQASLVFRDRVATRTSTAIERARVRGGAVTVGLTTASEFGGLNVSVTKLNGVTHNPWRHGRTVGGSSGGSAAAVAGGIVPLASAADGGGSIRIPAGYTGLFGFKGTYGRIPRGPGAYSRPSTEVFGCLARSVRDTARYLDVCAGPDGADPWSLPSHGRWEADLGTTDLTGLRVAVLPGLGGVALETGVEDRIREHASKLISATGMREVEVSLSLPSMATEWMMGNVSTLAAELGGLWPGCAGELTDAIEDGLRLSQSFYNLHTAAVAESKRLATNRAMAELFEKVDLVLAATNPGPAFAADQVMASPPNKVVDRLLANRASRGVMRGLLALVRVTGGFAPRAPARLLAAGTRLLPDIVDMGGLTIISNVYGNPAASIPAGLVGGLPVGLQVLGRPHEDQLVLEVGLAAERELPWPLTATQRSPASSSPSTGGSKRKPIPGSVMK